MKLVASKDVDKIVREHLNSLGYTLSKEKKPGETGCDIIAKKREESLFVEVIRFQNHLPIRSREFYECFFRIISRDRAKSSDVLIIALPIEFARGMAQRKKHYGLAWDKLGHAFPNLCIWYIDRKSGKITKRSWLDCVVHRQEGGRIKSSSIGWHDNSLRGHVVKEWVNSGRVNWNLQETISTCMRCDQELAEQGCNPAPAFRKAIQRKDKSYIKQWVLGCRYPWLKRKE